MRAINYTLLHHTPQSKSIRTALRFFDNSDLSKEIRSHVDRRRGWKTPSRHWSDDLSRSGCTGSAETFVNVVNRVTPLGDGSNADVRQDSRDIRSGHALVIPLGVVMLQIRIYSSP